MSSDRADLVDERLAQGEIVVLERGEWDAIADRFEPVEEHDTVLAGALLVVKGAAGLAAVERPARGQRVVRPLADMEAAQRFVTDRLETYERMWDGCGCRVDYFR